MREGDKHALGHLTSRVYEELRHLARRELARGTGFPTLRTTGLVHEAYLKLVDQTRVRVDDRPHFLALAATAMRHIVIDHARSRQTQKRGGGWQRVTLDEAASTPSLRPSQIIALDEAMQRLERYDRRLCKVVECRFFGGMTVRETASALTLAPRTVDRDWQKAKAWLYREMLEA